MATAAEQINELQNKIALVQRTFDNTSDKGSQMAVVMKTKLDDYKKELKELEEAEKKNGITPSEPIAKSSDPVEEPTNAKDTEQAEPVFNKPIKEDVASLGK